MRRHTSRIPARGLARAIRGSRLVGFPLRLETRRARSASRGLEPAGSTLELGFRGSRHVTPTAGSETRRSLLARGSLPSARPTSQLVPRGPAPLAMRLGAVARGTRRPSSTLQVAVLRVSSPESSSTKRGPYLSSWRLYSTTRGAYSCRCEAYRVHRKSSSTPRDSYCTTWTPGPWERRLDLTSSVQALPTCVSGPSLCESYVISCRLYLAYRRLYSAERGMNDFFREAEGRADAWQPRGRTS